MRIRTWPCLLEEENAIVKEREIERGTGITTETRIGIGTVTVNVITIVIGTDGTRTESATATGGSLVGNFPHGFLLVLLIFT